jgi:hypothetical protein
MRLHWVEGPYGWVAGTARDPSVHELSIRIRVEEADVDPGAVRIAQVLLSIGGECACFSFGDTFWFKPYADDGMLEPFKTVTLRRMLKNKSQRNVARFWREQGDPDRYRIGQGWALCDQAWHQHGWIVDLEKRRIIETTVKREAYFGIRVPTGLEDEYTEDVLEALP